MKYLVYILALTLCTAVAAEAQRPAEGGKRGQQTRSPFRTLSSPNEVPDSLINNTQTDSIKRITAFRLSERLGEISIAPMDTSRLNFGQSAQMEANGLAIGYLGPLGSPSQSKVFIERGEGQDFIFANDFNYFSIYPDSMLYYNAKLPYTNIMYTQNGANVTREERLKGVVTMNFGKKFNVGFDADYLYARGAYNSQGGKHLTYRLFSSYNSDKYSIHGYLANSNFVNYENGGVIDDRYVTHPQEFAEGRKEFDSKSIPTLLNDTWNRFRTKRFYFTQRYNLGFYKDVNVQDEKGENVTEEQFVPVSSLIHTFDYSASRRRFISNMPVDSIAKLYENNYIDGNVNDTTSYWSVRNTLGISLREGFHDLAKFGVTAYAGYEIRNFKLMSDNRQSPDSYTQNNFVIGGEIAKRRGSILTYNADAEFCLAGYKAGELKIGGELQTKFPLFRKEASVRAFGYFKNLAPNFYEQRYHSKFYWWDNDFGKVRRVLAGGEVNLASTNTSLMASVENIQNFIYFNSKGLPTQNSGSVQILTARLKQNFYYRALGWENDIVFQQSSDQVVLPLPKISVSSNLYAAFPLVKVLTLQIGTNVYYTSSYFAPYYQAASMQFVNQDQVKVGNFPLMNVYLNAHLKQARFFVMYYNVGAKFMTPNYFSLAHYPLNPPQLRVGISVMFNN